MPSYIASIPSPPQGVWDIGPFPVRAYAAVPLAEPHDHLRSGGWLPTGEG